MENLAKELGLTKSCPHCNSKENQVSLLSILLSDTDAHAKSTDLGVGC